MAEKKQILDAEKKKKKTTNPKTIGRMGLTREGRVACPGGRSLRKKFFHRETTQ